MSYFAGVKILGPKFDHLLHYSAEIQKGGAIPPLIPTSLHAVGMNSFNVSSFLSVYRNTENQLLRLLARKGLQRMWISWTVSEHEVLYAWCASE